MFNLSEEWKRAYAEFLKEDEAQFNEDVDSLLVELTESQTEIEKGFDIVSSYYSLCCLTEEGPLGTVTQNKSWKEAEKEDRESSKSDSKPMKDADRTVNDIVLQISKFNRDGDIDYEAASRNSIESIGDMKFPKNVIFFIAQILRWIKNVVLYFISKFMNIIRRLLNKPEKELDPETLKLSFNRIKTLENSSKLAKAGKAGDVVSVRVLNPDAVEKVGLTEGITDVISNLVNSTVDAFKGPEKSDTKVKNSAEPANGKNAPIMITVDLSKDMLSLKELVQHFYDLFDNAYGSNNEKLFEADDLKSILEVFKNTLNTLQTGELNVYAVNGSSVELSAVNSSRVKDNLTLTNTNINALKEAYMQTGAKIKDLTRIMSSKEMLMIADMGTTYSALTTSTLTQLQNILKTIDPRMKQAGKMEKDMMKVQKQYEKLVDQLSGLQRSFASVSNISYDTIYNRKMIELLNSAKMMSQVVTLRLVGLGLYIKEMSEVRDALGMLASLNGNIPLSSVLKNMKLTLKGSNRIM